MHAFLDVSLKPSGFCVYTSSLCYRSVSCLGLCPFGGLAFSSLSVSSRILALLHAVEGDIDDRN